VYCTQKKESLLTIIRDGEDVYGTEYHGNPVFIKTDASSGDTEAWINGWCKKVIGEFTVDRIAEVTVKGEDSCFPWAFYGDEPFNNHPLNLRSGGITLDEYLKYKGKGKVYGWHIADYKLYDKPKKITDFKRWNRTEEKAPCAHVKSLYEPCETCAACNLKRPPQSWCYVEELEGTCKEN
jgi:predicted transcriptional regulator